MVTGGEVNYGIWSDAQFDSLVEQAINELEPDKQAESPPRPSRSSWTMRPSCPCMKTA